MAHESDPVIEEGMQLLLAHNDAEITSSLEDERRIEMLAAAKARTATLKAKRDRILEVLTPHVMPVISASANQMLAPVTQSAIVQAMVATTPLSNMPKPGQHQWKRDVIDRIERMVANERMRPEEIYKNLEAQGVNFDGLQKPAHRLVQIMSGAKQFESVRPYGWTLRSLAPSAEHVALTSPPPPPDQPHLQEGNVGDD